jgi:predicted metalloprotease with PDZ domain
LTSSIGLVLKEDGQVIDVVPGKAADKAGVGPHMKVLAVNGRRLTGERLREALQAARDGKTKLRLLAENGDYFRIYSLDYTDGERYPQLMRDESKPDLIAEILRAKAKKLGFPKKQAHAVDNRSITTHSCHGLTSHRD